MGAINSINCEGATSLDASRILKHESKVHVTISELPRDLGILPEFLGTDRNERLWSPAVAFPQPNLALAGSGGRRVDCAKRNYVVPSLR